MLKWVQSGLSAVAGTAEQNMDLMQFSPSPKRIFDTNNGKIYRATEPKDFEWLSPNYTNVETQTFYFTDLSNGNIGFAQIIHSNVMGLTTTAQFTFRLYNVKDKSINLWTSTKVEDFEIKDSNFYAKDLSLELKDNKVYKLRVQLTRNPSLSLKWKD